MRSYDPAVIAHLNAGGGLAAKQCVWVTARNLTTDLIETIGFWTGRGDRDIDVDGDIRRYQGAGEILQFEPITWAAGLDVRAYRIQAVAVNPVIEDLAKGFDLRFAAVECHQIQLDPETRQIIGAPWRFFAGQVDHVSFPESEVGGAVACVLDLVSATIELTRPLSVRKSDAAHQEQSGGDRIRKYGDISGTVPVYWGEKRLDAAPSKPFGFPTFDGLQK